MKNRIDETFERLKERGDKALIGYVTAGFPTLDSFEAVVPKLQEAGMDILEIGIPFSDPIADGPTIQHASQVALENGVTLKWTLEATQRLRAKTTMPFIYMSYCNPIYAMGVEHFFQSAKEAGVDGVIIPDLIPEEAEIYSVAAEKHGIHLIYLASPTTPLDRLKTIGRDTRGFLYVVSLTGVTGARQELPKNLSVFVKQAKRVSQAPVAVGFGISTPEQAREAARFADGVIVGSALIKALHPSSAPTFSEALEFIASLKKELNHAS
jgi:tryptophan synthase alpha chain